jgi:hypothetical protein
MLLMWPVANIRPLSTWCITCAALDCSYKLGLTQEKLVVPDYVVCTELGNVFRVAADQLGEAADHLIRGQ